MPFFHLLRDTLLIPAMSAVLVSGMWCVARKTKAYQAVTSYRAIYGSTGGIPASRIH